MSRTLPAGAGVAAIDQILPLALRRKLPYAWLLFLRNRAVFEGVCLIVCFLVLDATLLGPPYQLEWGYALAATAGPLACVAWYVLVPLNPYETDAARRSGMAGSEVDDIDAKRLVMILKSQLARRFLWALGARISLVLTIPIAIMFLIFRRAPIWRFGPDYAIRVPTLALLLFVIVRMELVWWGLKNWSAAPRDDRLLD